MHTILNVYKPSGWTPLAVVKRIKENFPEYKNEKIGYAGRLDPLAHGVLLLMIGEETTRNKDEFLYLPKTYEFEAVFGVATDTYDALGLVKPNLASYPTKAKIATKINKFISTKLGKQLQTYPPYSSKTVKGKPLYWWAKNDKLSEITLPKREIEIYNFRLQKVDRISAPDLQKEILRQIDSVSGEFRQTMIRKAWAEFFQRDDHSELFLTARFTVSCSSGTYVRSLVNELGEQLGCAAITLEIFRTKVGEYTITDSIRMDKE